ncbi:unnamed protein product [Caenorhabditis auriculariae]|uniref:Uncharacterized protein n=1 Tax=Caenorhabditis auriculariae TaxID=2777116 RepID=A0A8S1H330_9PELO|nr:unnamed protein product [Caenorhabditis auriculariae]
MSKTLFLTISFLTVVFAEFDPHFQFFLQHKLGKEVAEKFARKDVANIGSFGGGLLTGEQKVRPIVLVHGFRNQADSLWKIRRDFVASGFPFDESLQCAHVKHIRDFINAISRYTWSKVDVIAYSMGAPLSRKAILGGQCIENGELLGKPLTRKIHSFISVAGANHGSYLCSTFPFGNICNFVNGLACDSKFLKEVNSKKHYEGKNVYSIASEDDDVVGYKTCGRKTSKIYGSKEIVLKGLNHEETEFDTANIQLALVRAA